MCDLFMMIKKPIQNTVLSQADMIAYAKSEIQEYHPDLILNLPAIERLLLLVWNTAESTGYDRCVKLLKTEILK
jgi:hypothetical protein